MALTKIDPLFVRKCDTPTEKFESPCFGCFNELYSNQWYADCIHLGALYWTVFLWFILYDRDKIQNFIKFMFESILIIITQIYSGMDMFFIKTSKILIWSNKLISKKNTMYNALYTYSMSLLDHVMHSSRKNNAKPHCSV